MNRNRNGSKRRRANIRVWSYDEARRAAPYIASVMGSLREHWLDVQTADRKTLQLNKQPGRPDRTRLVAHAEAARRADEARNRLEEAEEELTALDVFCIDPIRAEAVIPFVHDKQLAWYVFDRFDEDPIRAWRYHSDPLDTRRPIAEALLEPPQVA
ncbi:MAG: DUF2203 family protein [Gemmataceae bacterium]|nr:DUF2203 family protein [Gemmataceae bacterium]